jgi:glucose-1-phosphate cytidylyltransferase
MSTNRSRSHPPTVILCGGKGTRLREETEYRPKPMVELGGRPILWHIMRIYAHYGHKNFVLCLGYKGDMIKQYFLNYRAMENDFTVKLGHDQGIRINSGGDHDVDWSVTLADTGIDTMTGARVKRVAQYLDTDTFMLTYGDGLADINLESLLRFHREMGKIVTVTGVHPPSRFGELKVTGNVVVDFEEKPQVSQGMVNGGFFVCQREFLDYLDDTPACVLEREPLMRVAADGELAVFSHDGFWQCMDTYREYEILNGLWEANEAPWGVWR